MVGGKLDLEEVRTVEKTEAQELAKKHGFYEFMECSSKTGENVEAIFKTITHKMIETAGYLK
jgi:GTPase Era involved in 16S rRNA processing